MIFLRHYIEVHFRLPVKKTCSRSEVVWCRGDFESKSPANDVPQARISSVKFLVQG
jgi:hypothetical protein